jgi:hypothetical protein
VSGRTAFSLSQKRAWAKTMNGIFSLILITFLGCWLDASEIRFHLPVRLTGEAQADQALKPEDFRLVVNGADKNIQAVKRKQKSLAIKPDLGREFILSFKLSKYGSAVERELAYFVTEILDTSDSLYLLTPGQLYRLNVSANKGSIQREIRELLEKDCPIFRDEWTSAEARLKSYLEGLKTVLDGDPQGVDIYKQTSLFLNVFPEEFSRYQNRFLVPDPKRYEHVLSQLGFGEGERWWVHFEQHQDPKLYQKIQGIIKAIDDHIYLLSTGHQALAIAMKASLTRLEETLTLPNSFPSAELVEVLAANETNYNVVFIRGDSIRETNLALAPFVNLVALYGEVAKAAGGMAVSAGTDERALTKIVNHVEEYCELAFDWDGRIEDARIQVLVKGQADDLRYAEHLTQAQVDSRVQFFSREKVRIDDVSVTAGRLTFVVNAFERKKENDFGLLRIRVLLLDDGNQSVYKQENTLRATKEKVSISLPFPEGLKGTFQLSIKAYDLIANRLADDERQIDLK